VVEDRPIMSAKYRLPVKFGQNCPMQQSHGLFATAKLLVNTAPVFDTAVDGDRVGISRPT